MSNRTFAASDGPRRLYPKIIGSQKCPYQAIDSLGGARIDRRLLPDIGQEEWRAIPPP